MNLTAAAYWQAVPNYSSLLLQQYQCRGMPFCLTVLCSGEDRDQARAGAYLTGSLSGWFRDLPFSKLASDPERKLSQIRPAFLERLNRLEEELRLCGLIREKTSCIVSGILSFDCYFLLFGSSFEGICLLNREFGNSRVQSLEKETAAGRENGGAFCVRQGMLERELGLLFVTDSLGGKLCRQEMADCLAVDRIHSREQAARHLKELGNRAQGLGGENMAAALLLTG